MNVTAVILVKNEVDHIEACVQSVLWCNEILLIADVGSNDSLRHVSSYPVTILHHDLSDNFSAQRNHGLQHASNTWVLFVDADELVTDGLQQEIQALHDGNKSIQGYYMKREDFLWGKKMTAGELGSLWLLRLAKRDKGKWFGKVHEVWKISGQTAKLLHPLYHYPHQSVGEFVSKINYYSTLRAEELYQEHKTVSGWEIVSYPIGKFLLNYYLRRGYADGIAGFLVASLMSMHSFLVRAKLWQLQKK